MIKVSSLAASQQRLVRETTAPFILVEKGEERIEQIAVRYYAFSIAEGRAYREGLAKLGDMVLFSDLLLPMLESLPDFVDEKDKPVKITREFLEGLNSINLQAIHTAVGEDLVPKPQKTRSPSG